MGSTAQNALPVIEEVLYHVLWTGIHIYILFCFLKNENSYFFFLVPRWPGCRTPWSLRLLVHWISKRTWLAVSICFCVESSLTSIPPIWPSVYAHLDRRLTTSLSPLLGTVLVSAAANLFLKPKLSHSTHVLIINLHFSIVVLCAVMVARKQTKCVICQKTVMYNTQYHRT